LPIAIDASSRYTPILQQELTSLKTRSTDFYHGLLEQDADLIEARKGGSRWARLVAEIAYGSMSLGEEAAARFEQDRQNFREQCHFKHDEDE
jgi:hypothetical protein